jgi:ABC-type uncharacterized transport system ATPase subunit
MSESKQATGTTATPQTPPATALAAEPAPILPQARMSLVDALDKINILEAAHKNVTDELAKVRSERDQANSVLDAQIRATYLNKVRGISNIPETQLQKMSTHDLENLVQSNEMLKHNNPKSIQFAVDEPNRDEGLIDLYSERLKRRRE